MLSVIITMPEEGSLARQLDGAATLRAPIKPLTAGHFARWMPPSYRSAMALLEDVRGHRGLEPDEDLEDTAPSAGPLREEPQDRDHSVKVARVMAEYHARKRAERRREQVLRWEDARALMAVRDWAASVGEVNVSRFNAAYRQRYPMPTSAERRRRALVLTPRGHMVDATVRGPNGAEFTVSRHERVGERTIVETLMSRIEAAIPRFDWTKVDEWAEPTPENEETAHEPPVDEDAPAQEPEVGTAGTDLDEPEAVVDVKRAIEVLTRMVFGGRKHEATDVAPEVEDQEEVDAIEEVRLAGEPVDAEEPDIADGSAGPKPREEAVEHESVTPVAGSGESTGAHLPDMVESHPTVTELAERTCAGRPMAPVSPRAPTPTAADEPPLLRTPIRATARRPGRSTAPADSLSSWAHPSVAAWSTVSLRPRSARTPGSCSPRGPPPSPVAPVEC